MSETAQRETELVAGVIGGITQKKADTWTVQVTPDGAKYAKNLWTKDADLVQSLSAKIGQVGAFVGSLGAPYTVDGKEVRSWWIQSEADGVGPTEEEIQAVVSAQPVDRVATPVAAPQAKSSGEGMSKEEWARKDSAIHKMACIKTAADALKHTIPSEPRPEDLRKYIENVKTLSYAWHQQVEAVRKGDDSDVPFLSEHDQEIPYG